MNVPTLVQDLDTMTRTTKETVLIRLEGSLAAGLGVELEAPLAGAEVGADLAIVRLR